MAIGGRNLFALSAAAVAPARPATRRMMVDTLVYDRPCADAAAALKMLGAVVLDLDIYPRGFGEAVEAMAGWNALGGDASDGGPSPLGRLVVEEMGALRMLVDLSHCGDRTTSEAIGLSPTALRRLPRRLPGLPRFTPQSPSPPHAFRHSFAPTCSRTATTSAPSRNS